ncbi:MAG: ribosome small subunit-dependent GTPase A [bacterium]|nr:ribosome small subunit-dependent GTPase A [bacterium]
MSAPTDVATGTVIGVFRGGCEVVHADRVISLRLVGKHAHAEKSLAVGDEVSFELEREVVIDLLPRRTRLARRRPRALHKEQVIAANIDRLAIVASVKEPPFRAGAVDRFLLAALAGGLDATLVVNKIDLLEGAALPDEIRAYEEVIEVLPVSAESGAGLEALQASMSGKSTVFAGHSGVGKSSLLNALEPELRLQTQEISQKYQRGRHTTTRAVWLKLANGAIAVDTPGVREIATGPVDTGLIREVYPELARYSDECRFRDCAHDAEPDCAVRAAVEAGKIRASRLSSYRKLLNEAGS